jgi:putative oxidoreductase
MREKVFSRGWGLLPLRLIIGFGFAAHGYAKLHRGPEKFEVILTALGVPQPHLTAWTTSLLEFIGGVSLMAGAFVALLSVPLMMVMLTALIKVHMQYGFSSVTLRSVSASGAEFGPVGYELNLLYIAGLVSLALSRPSALSVDAWLKSRKIALRRIAATGDRE